MARLGFVLLTHANPAQILRLTNRLAASFDGAPVACHHDFGQSPLDRDAFPESVRFVRRYVATRWGDISLVEATVAALRLLFEGGRGPDWFVLLSGVDYPLRSLPAVVADLEGGGADVYMQHAWIHPYQRVVDHGPGPLGYDVGTGRRNAHQCLRRYFRQKLRVPLPALGGRPRAIDLSSTNPWLVSRLAPYNDRFRCYAGHQWFTANRDAALHLLDWHDRNPWFIQYLRGRIAPDETYFHTVLLNAGRFRVHNDSFRYVDWSGAKQHPKTLGAEDLPGLLASRAHFARKFLHDSPLLDRLDEMLDSGER